MRRAVAWASFVLLVMGLGVLAQDVVFSTYDAGEHIIGVFVNRTGGAVTGLHLEFAGGASITIVDDLAIGGFLPALGPDSGREFDFAGGELLNYGELQLEWDDPEELPIFAQWLSGTQPVGAPYVILEAWLPTITMEEFGGMLANSIVTARELNPGALAAAFDAFFLANQEYFAGLEETLGMPLAASLMPVIESAPAEGIVNFFLTLTNMLGVATVPELLQGDVDFMSLLQLVGQ